MILIGEIAGLLTSFFFAANAVVLTKAGQRVGSVITNRARLVFALLYLVVLNFILFRQPLPLQAESSRWMWLSLSGVIGLALGDAFLFQAYLSIGPRLGMLLLSLSTIFSALEAWAFFGESLRWIQILGIVVTLGGIMWVILERGDGQVEIPRPSTVGVIFGILAAIGQATGLVFSKQGLFGGFSPISANVIRMLAATAAMWLFTAIQGRAGPTIRTLKADPQAVKLLALGAFLGPVAGVSLSLLAVQNIKIGVASVLTSLSPVFMLPFGYFFFKDRVGWQAILGTLVAMAGVVILFLY